jgi:murein DD-endopeptidase MepM/ murein hydrolase activator NlpD
MSLPCTVENRRVRAVPARWAAVFVLVVVLTWVVAEAPPVEAQNGRVVYQPPVAGPIIDDWRPPENPFGAGNRGVDFFAVPGQPVFAAADGVVTFAGQVGGSLFLVMSHADGLRTTIGFVGSITVRVGAVLNRGAKVAIAKGPVHFGVRNGNAYLDPRTLFARRVWLVE